MFSLLKMVHWDQKYDESIIILLLIFEDPWHMIDYYYYLIQKCYIMNEV